MKKSLAALLMLAGISYVLCGCGDNSNQANLQNGEISQTQTTSKSPIESLTSEEKAIFDALLIASDAFYSPQAIKKSSK